MVPTAIRIYRNTEEYIYYHQFINMQAGNGICHTVETTISLNTPQPIRGLDILTDDKAIPIDDKAIPIDDKAIPIDDNPQ